MHVRELPVELVERAVALWQEAGLTRPWNDPHEDLRRALANRTSTVLAALEDERLIRTVMAGYDGHRGWVYYLAVAADQPRQGVGRTLIAAAEDWLRALGVPKLNLMVCSTNLGVVGLYQGLGYEDSGVVVLGKMLLSPGAASARAHRGDERLGGGLER